MTQADLLSRPDPLLDTLEAESEHVFTEHDGRRISWRMWGRGRPVVFFHGGSGSWKHWLYQIEALRGDHRVIAPDLPGYGLSDDPIYPVDFRALGQDVADGLDEVLGRGESYVIVPFSFGGSVTSQMLLVHPGRQEGLVLCSAAGFMKPTAPPMQKVRGKAGDALVETHRANLGSIMIADAGRIDARALRIQHENTMQSRLRAMFLDRGKMLYEVLPGFRPPVTAIWGEKDAFMAPGTLAQRRDLLLRAKPDAEVHILPGVGHWVAYEAPDEVTAILRDFLAR